jgi:hypothetical protein
MKLKNYFFLLNIIGVIYFILFLIGFFTSNSLMYSIGGIGMFLFIRILIIGDQKKIWTLYSAIILFTLLFLLFKVSWYKTFFWITFTFVIGQIIPSLIIIFGGNNLYNSIVEKAEKYELISFKTLHILLLITIPFVFRNLFKI